MAILVLDAVVTGPAPKPSGAPRAPSAEEVARHAAEVMRKADKDGDGKLELNEMVAFAGDALSQAELEKKLVQFDRDGDQRLSVSELGEGRRRRVRAHPARIGTGGG